MDLKKIAKMQIGGPKYPDKKRINLYQREVKKGAVAGQIVTLAAFLVFLYGFSQVGIVMPMERPCGGCLSAYGSPAGSYEAGQQHYARSKNRICPLWKFLEK